MHHHDDHSHTHEQRVKPSPKAFFANFSTYDAPLLKKIALAVKNQIIKIRTRSNCCGNLGQPGC